MSPMSFLSIIVLLAALTLFFSIYSSSLSSSSLEAATNLQARKDNFVQSMPYHMNPREKKAVLELATALSYMEDDSGDSHSESKSDNSASGNSWYLDDRQSAARIAALLEDSEQGRKYSHSGLRRAKDDRAEEEAEGKLISAVKRIARAFEDFINEKSKHTKRATTNSKEMSEVESTDENIDWSDENALEEKLVKSANRPVNEWRFCQKHPDTCADAAHDRAMYENRAQRMSSAFASSSASQKCSSAVQLHLESKLHEWWGHILGGAQNSLHDCPAQCAVTSNPSDADVLVSFMDISPQKGPDQKSAVISLESFKGHGGHPINDATAEAADMLITFNRHSDVPVNYFYGLVGDNEENTCDSHKANRPANRPPCLPDAFPPQWDQLKNKFIASLFVSNCVSGRADYLRELMRYIDIASYGGCLHTDSLKAEGGSAAKVRLASQYKFQLAFENWPLVDYVTEKFWQGFQSGVIPVYWGAPNIEDFAPGYHSFINALDFEEPKDLAAYLLQVANNRTLYESYFEWRKYPPREKFLRMIDENFTQKGKTSWLCRICVKYEERFC